MLNTIIIEDEILTANRLEKLLHKLNPNILLLAKLDSIKSSVEWFNKNPMPSLIFMDIQISDGLSFEIFKQVNISAPVIFTTAYDQYAIEAFRVEGLDYLLKPIDENALKNTLERFYKKNSSTKIIIENILKHLPNNKEYRNRFLVSFRDSLQSISTDDIAYFVSEFKTTYLVTNTNQKFIITNSLEELEEQLNPKHFLRVSRQIIISSNCINSIRTFYNGKLKLVLEPNYSNEILISREKALILKDWLNK